MADCKNEQMGIVQIADKQGTDERINMSITDVMYWLDKMQEKDRLIYTKEEIERLNRQIYCRCLETGDMFDIKEIVKGESYILLSSEEMDALRQAVHFGENKVR